MAFIEAGLTIFSLLPYYKQEGATARGILALLLPYKTIISQSSAFIYGVLFWC